MKKTYHILAVDDDREICTLLAEILSKHGFKVSTAANGAEMEKILEQHQVDLILLDVMMPGDDGITICKKLRLSSQMPIIMISAAGEDDDRITGLEVGADDYLAKPFNPKELLARIDAVLRRATTADGKKYYNAFCFNHWILHINKRCLISPENVTMPLGSAEFDLMMIFLNNPQKLLSRDDITKITKNRESSPYERGPDMQISRLRKKIEKDPKHPEYIKTVRGGGYIFSENVTKKRCL
ncbi:MAG: response regulator [Pseudomonadota bacterium]